ncbi:hypothetical protein BJ508DRAFT_363963 [Ascobolus immersus RN42]|uniref:Uncharacterized protein n=1 Tax=Ascobolus immersus RN42 TaxID=1160509 RepID=A0A3N4HX91_ASCIM|nr:hypothetical protein BJ508DRAFT_363963 [Ascobolus immersus RN42]
MGLRLVDTPVSDTQPAELHKGEGGGEGEVGEEEVKEQEGGGGGNDKTYALAAKLHKFGEEKLASSTKPKVLKAHLALLQERMVEYLAANTKYDEFFELFWEAFDVRLEAHGDAAGLKKASEYFEACLQKVVGALQKIGVKQGEVIEEIVKCEALLKEEGWVLDESVKEEIEE